jgi:hypothetical protein
VSVSRLGALIHRLRDTADDVEMLARLARDLPGNLRRPLSLDQARAQLLARMAAREERFLSLVERAIYGHPRSPSLRLLRHAGCELGDLHELVDQEGVEGALRKLAALGVYVMFDELKGHREVVRGSLRFSIREHETDNPLVRPHLLLHTSGSGGRPSRVRLPLAFFEEQSAALALLLAAHGVERPRTAFWWPVPVQHMIMYGMLGYPVTGWFYPVHPLPIMATVAARYLAAVGRLAGYDFPLPERCDLSTPERMVDWLTTQVSAGGPLVMLTMSSATARLSSAASSTGRRLEGVTLCLAGEPTTEARRRHVEASAARTIVQYSSVELGGLSYGCATPDAADDVHVITDRYAVVQRRRPVFDGGPSVDATLVTSLSASAPKIAPNAELGDYASLEERDCDCLFGALGMRTHLSEIRSFEKLTGEGVTFVRGNLERILDEVLPGRFGGTGADYQLVEESADATATRVVLRVNPSVGEVDAQALRTAFLEELGRGNPMDQYQVGMWRSTGTVEIRREPPLATRAGKVLPFQVLERIHRTVESTRRP